jgi:hypothetical protein
VPVEKAGARAESRGATLAAIGIDVASSALRAGAPAFACGAGGCSNTYMGVYGTMAPNGPPEFLSVVAKGGSRTGIDITIVPSSGVEAVKKPLPKKFALAEPLPNPFNPTVTLCYDVPASARISISIYDISGHLVRKLVDGMRYPGSHQAVWDGRNGLGLSVASGLYLCRMQAGGFVKDRKMLMLK